VPKQLIRLGLIEVVFLGLGILSARALTVLTDTTLIWRSLGTPPGKAIRVVDGDYLAVRVQTLQGRTYFCRFKSPNECWIHNEQSSYSPYTYDRPWTLQNYREPPPLRGVVYTRKLYNWLSEYTQVLTVYAITEKGEVYVWQDGLGTAGYDYFFYSYVGIPVVLVCGLVFWRYVEWRVISFQRMSFQRRMRAIQNGE
jgi:hypothetical protein